MKTKFKAVLREKIARAIWPGPGKFNSNAWEVADRVIAALNITRPRQPASRGGKEKRV